MEERQVTADGTTYVLDQPFTVVATQNPVEMEGTYPLPEAQRDRFMARISMGYPSPADEIAMLSTRETSSPLDRLGAGRDARRAPRHDRGRAARVHLAARQGVRGRARPRHARRPPAAPRREPARDAAAHPRGEGPRGHARPRLRAARRRRRARGARARAPARADEPCASARTTATAGRSSTPSCAASWGRRRFRSAAHEGTEHVPPALRSRLGLAATHQARRHARGRRGRCSSRCRCGSTCATSCCSPSSASRCPSAAARLRGGCARRASP